MYLFYNRVMAYIFMKDKKRFQKHVRRIIDNLKTRSYYLIVNAPEEVLDDVETVIIKVAIWRDIYYNAAIKVSDIKEQV